MLARIQQVIALILFLAVFGAAGFGLVRGSALLPFAFIAFAIAGYGGALAYESLSSWRSYAAEDSLRPRLSQLFRAWLVEVMTAPLVFLWLQPFRSLAEPDLLLPRPGVLFVHGFFCNRGIWNPWLKALRARRFAFVAINLEPLFGSIDCYATSIETAVESLVRGTGHRPVIVAHSMGGLAVRAWAQRTGALSRVRHVVTVATPHRGTLMARHSHVDNGRQMRIGSPWITALASAENEAWAERFTCFWSHCDNIVFPTRNATLPGADNRHLAATPHVQMVYHPAIFAEVLRMLDSQDSAADR